MTFNIGYTF